MKLTLICLSIFVAAASTAPQFRASGSPLLSVQPFARNNKLGLLIPAGGLINPGQGNNIRIKDVLNPVTLVKPTPENESKPIELSSRTPTVAETSRCKQNYRKKEEEEEVRTVVPFVVGGDISSKNQFPFLVALVLYNDKIKDYKLNCGGSLISPTKILTAAHCVTYHKSTKVIDVDQFQVKLGMHFINDTSDDAQLTRNIIKIKIHEDYDNSGTLNDIAILTLDSPVKYTNTISPICLVPSCLNDDDEQEVTAMGWGHTQFNGSASDYLKSARLSTVPNAKCKETYKNSLVEDQMLCAYKEGQDTCQGDSGGPLVIDVNEGRQSGFEKSCRFMQVGIVSWGKGCAEKGIPGVYTRVKNYLRWISKNSSK